MRPYSRNGCTALWCKLCDAISIHHTPEEPAPNPSCEGPHASLCYAPKPGNACCQPAEDRIQDVSCAQWPQFPSFPAIAFKPAC